MRRVSRPNQRLWVISTLLIALFVRALIPTGFMPATDRPFSFQICPDGFPAALLNDAAGTATPTASGAYGGATTLTGSHAGHHHDGGMLAHAGHHHDDGGARVHAGHAADGLLAVAHHHDGPAHNHSSASAEHCVFAAAAGVFALAWAATFSAPAATITAPEVDYLPPAFESLRFRLPQPRGPPALS
jgi:hypothetical protein